MKNGVKKWLMRAWNADKELQTLRKVKQQTYDRLTKATPSLSGNVVSSSTEEHKMDAYAVICDECEIKELQLLNMQAEIIKVIHQLNDPTIETVLIERYIRCRRWEEIADSMYISLRQVYNLHGRGLQRLKDFIFLHY